MMEFAAATGPRLMLDETSLMDIGGCVVEGIDIAPKEAVPDDGDARISHSVQGFLFTCGPDHIRHRDTIPGRSDGKVYPLHGSAAGHAAKVLWTKFENGNAECRADIDIVTVEGLAGPHRAALVHRRPDGRGASERQGDQHQRPDGADLPDVPHEYRRQMVRRWTRLEGAMLEGGGFPWRFGKDGDIFCVEAPATENGLAEVRLGPIAADRRQDAEGARQGRDAAASAGLAQPDGACRRARHRAGVASLGGALRA
jgi:hypothetical protein